jgi:hypothetical protein
MSRSALPVRPAAVAAPARSGRAASPAWNLDARPRLCRLAGTTTTTTAAAAAAGDDDEPARAHPSLEPDYPDVPADVLLGTEAAYNIRHPIEQQVAKLREQHRRMGVPAAVQDGKHGCQVGVNLGKGHWYVSNGRNGMLSAKEKREERRKFEAVAVCIPGL